MPSKAEKNVTNSEDISRHTNCMPKALQNLVRNSEEIPFKTLKNACQKFRRHRS